MARRNTEHSDIEAELLDAHKRRNIRRHRSLVLHSLRRLLARPKPSLEVMPLPEVGHGQVSVSFIGHASALLRYADLSILCDPMLGSWIGPMHRENQPGLMVSELGCTDLILITQDRIDHLHRGTLRRLPSRATVITPAGTAKRLSDLGFARVVELGVGQSIQHRGVDIFSAPIRDTGARRPGVSYIVRGNGPSVYFCGSSGYFSGFSEIGKRYAPDIALLPIGGYAPLALRDYRMSPYDALQAFHDLRARVMIPIHHSAFTLSYEQLTEPTQWLEQLVRQRALDAHVLQLEPGQSRLFRPARGQIVPADVPTGMYIEPQAPHDTERMHNPVPNHIPNDDVSQPLVALHTVPQVNQGSLAKSA